LELDALIAKDMRDSVKTNDAPFIRYITFPELAGRKAELENAGKALSKLMNSTSWDAKIKVPQKVSDAPIYKIDLRDYGPGWNKDKWETVVDHNPYVKLCSSFDGNAIRAATGSKSPSLDGNWFLARVSSPPLYEKVLELPKTGAELEKLLGVDTEKNILEGVAKRAGIGHKKSGVSGNNRIIERHPTQYGAYWKSYDFDNSDGQKNIFEHPFGPKGKDSFKHGGGEMFFNLPNGMQAYYLAQIIRSGESVIEKSIPRGPRDIVSDSIRKDGFVTNGTSCMGCHSDGIKDEFKDEVYADAQRAAALDPEKFQNVAKLYHPAGDKAFEQDILSDKERFKKALRDSGAGEGKDLVSMFSNSYDETPIDLNRAALELGLSSAELTEKIKNDPILRAKLGQLLDGGSMYREQFEPAFAATGLILKDDLKSCPLLKTVIECPEDAFSKEFDDVRRMREKIDEESKKIAELKKIKAEELKVKELEANRIKMKPEIDKLRLEIQSKLSQKGSEKKISNGVVNVLKDADTKIGLYNSKDPCAWSFENYDGFKPYTHDPNNSYEEGTILIRDAVELEQVQNKDGENVILGGPTTAQIQGFSSRGRLTKEGHYRQHLYNEYIDRAFVTNHRKVGENKNGLFLAVGEMKRKEGSKSYYLIDLNTTSKDKAEKIKNMFNEAVKKCDKLQRNERSDDIFSLELPNE